MPLLIFIAFALLITFIGFLISVLKKKRMRRALGRDVKDHELNSLTSWMEVAENEDKLRQQK